MWSQQKYCLNGQWAKTTAEVTVLCVKEAIGQSEPARHDMKDGGIKLL